MLSLYIQAPFAVFRTFSAGWYRPSATFLSPSAAYGLLLNVAGIETRLAEEDKEHDGKTPASLTKDGLPAMRIAIGAAEARGKSGSPFPLMQTLLQQLHNYPVGKDAGMPKELAKGNKNNITPVRRDVLSDLRAIVCVDADQTLVDRIRKGLSGEFNDGRYGLPFLGDNQFLLDRVEETTTTKAHWYEAITESSDGGMRPLATRMTVWIDRADTSKTISRLYAPLLEATDTIPDDAWTQITPPGAHDQG